MVEYGIDLDARPVAKQLQKIGRDMPAINRTILGLLAKAVIHDADLNYLRGQVLKRPSGKLAQSLDFKVYDNYAEVGTNMKYASIHEFGGVIRPVAAQNLAIPIGTMKGSPKDHTNLKFTMRAGGKKFLEDDSGRLQYVLKKSVTIPARPFLGPPLRDLFKSGKAVLIADRELQRQFDRRD